MEEKEKEQQQDSGKIEKKFQENLSKLMGLLKGNEQVFKEKVPNEDMDLIIEELIKERKEKTIEEFKKKASNILDKKVEFDKFVKQKESELKSAINNKRKEFSKEMEDCFNLVENINSLHQQYKNSLKEAQQISEETEQTTETED